MTNTPNSMHVDFILSLPTDLRQHIIHHWCASRVQSRWRRWSLYRHTRTPMWTTLRSTWTRALHRDLLLYSGIRREWRVEPGSWYVLTDDEIRTIQEEAHAGLWGSKSSLPGGEQRGNNTKQNTKRCQERPTLARSCAT